MSDFEFLYDPKESDVPKLHEQIVYLINKMRFPWIDYEKESPQVGQICIGLHKSGMCFFEHKVEPIEVIMKGLFWVPRNGSFSGARYAVTDITHWVPLPEAYDT